MTAPASPENRLAENRILKGLPKDVFDRVTARMDAVEFGLRDMVYRTHQPITNVYFPRSGVLSMIAVMQDGGAVEVATIGNEGMLGHPLIMGDDRSQAQVFCQVPSVCRRMTAAAFREETTHGGPFSAGVLRFTQALFVAVSQSTACNKLHVIEERCARWLLTTHDRVVGDQFPITHEFLALMLGASRPTVSVAAGMLQSAGLIEYSRGKVTIRDRARLEEASCECYRVVKAEFDRLSS